MTEKLGDRVFDAIDLKAYSEHCKTPNGGLFAKIFYGSQLLPTKKKRKNKLQKGVKSYHNINNDSDSTEPALLTNSLSTPTLNRFTNKQLKKAIVNNTENVTILLNQIQVPM